MRFRIAVAIALLLCSTALLADVTLPTSIGYITLPDGNFADAVVGGSFTSSSLIFNGTNAMGPFTPSEVAPYVLGSNLGNGLGLAGADYLIPGFASLSIVNGAGNDLVLWEAGGPAEPFYLAISLDGGVTFSGNQLYNTVITNPLATTAQFGGSGYNINTGFVNLDDFGILAGQRVDAIRISGVDTGVGGSGPDVLAIGVINAGEPTGNVNHVPEPASFPLILSGLAGLAPLLRKKRS